MNRLRLTLVVLALATTIFTSCRGKDDGVAPEEVKTQEKLLASNLWVVDSFTFVEPQEIDNEIVYDLMDQLEECEKDNYINFRHDGTGASHDNVHVCEMGPSTQDEFKWTIDRSINELVMDYGNGDYERFKIISITDNSVLLHSYENPEEDLAAMKFLFKPL